MTDLNTLIAPGSPLFLQGASSINSRGEIAGNSVDQSTGETLAFLATPCNEGRSDDEGCKDNAEGAIAAGGETAERPKIALPENVREQLRQRRGFGRFGTGLMRPQ
jgi:hypothetical protein